MDSLPPDLHDLYNELCTQEQRTIRNVCQLDPDMQPKVLRVIQRLRELGWQAVMAEGIRTIKQQREKVNKGYSYTMKSKHLKGLAADIIDKRYGWSGPASSKDFQFWIDLGRIAKEEGLFWGGDWKMRDVAHVELRK